ncbi:MAG: VWA domain-containing protein, partial [Anaerolineae bacterium]|nr:VWA domain-containing protein [Anaerolineae bacterium]
MKRTLPLFFTILILLLGVGVTSAQVIVPPPCPLDAPCRGVFTDPSWLHIDYQRVDVDIDNQIATTAVDMQFTNVGDGLAEGTFVFPLPEGAAVNELTMWVDGQPIEAKILAADEARAVYDEIVRQFRDPALLEYIGDGAIQANIFPIPPGESRRVQISYGQVLEVDNGLIHYVYPMHSAVNARRMIESMSVRVNVISSDPISTIYSPSHNIAINRAQDTANAFTAGFEATNFTPDADFSLFYGISSDNISLNLLTYRESASEDGFFMLLVQPPVSLPQERIIPKDVIIVLDQSGSMEGDKWSQAQQAATYVLKNLNPEDRFNLVLFSTGWRLYSNNMENPAQAADAANWINNEEAAGGTDINGSLLAALDHVQERPTTIIFMTDGLATEGETTVTSEILENLQAADRPNARIFTFGVGNDVDTVLLDSIVRDHRGASSYVRPSERIDEEVASLFNKISAPVLTDVDIDFGGAQVEWMYPTQMPDLFAGEQLTLVGRYRRSTDDTTITLSGTVNGESQTFVYADLDFPGRAGGQPFIAQLWATRRIGDLLNSIRLNGESQELVDSVVSLSVRYGIITPYTSFLIEEDDILSQEGRRRALDTFAEEAESLASEFTGAGAVDAADAAANMAAASAPLAPATPTAQGTA